VTCGLQEELWVIGTEMCHERAVRGGALELRVAVALIYSETLGRMIVRNDERGGVIVIIGICNTTEGKEKEKRLV